MDFKLEMYLIDKVGLTNGDVIRPGEGVIEYGDFVIRIQKAIQTMYNNCHSPQRDRFTNEGYQIEFLRSSGGGWQKGRFKIRLEFIPDNPEAFAPNPAESTPSPLDDLRQSLDK